MQPATHVYAAPPAKKGMGAGTIILIVVACIVLLVVVGGIIFGAVATGKYTEAQKKQAQVDARTIHPAAEKYRIDHPGDRCPTVELLRETKEISQASKITDPWETTYKIVCGDEEVWVISFGADKKEGTADDIRIPDTTAVPDTKPARTPRPACTCQAGDPLCSCL